MTDSNKGFDRELAKLSQEILGVLPDWARAEFTEALEEQNDDAALAVVTRASDKAAVLYAKACVAHEAAIANSRPFGVVDRKSFGKGAHRLLRRYKPLLEAQRELEKLHRDFSSIVSERRRSRIMAGIS